MTCGSIFDDDYRKKHETKVHDDKRVKIKHIGAPDNPFKLAMQNFEKVSNKLGNIKTINYKIML